MDVLSNTLLLVLKAMGSFLAILQTSTVDCSEATLSVVRLFSEFLSRGKVGH